MQRYPTETARRTAGKLHGGPRLRHRFPLPLAIVRQDGFGNRTFFRLLDVPVFRIGRHLLVPLALESERGGAAPEVCSQTRRRLARSKLSRTTFLANPCILQHHPTFALLRRKVQSNGVSASVAFSSARRYAFFLFCGSQSSPTIQKCRVSAQDAIPKVGGLHHYYTRRAA